jgi:Ca-activated chloride channel homolog
VATRISHDIVLVLDRSGSMAFDLSASEFVYPPDRSVLGSPLQCYFMPPSPTASRWKALCDAVNAFTTTLTARNLDVHVALVTYADTWSFGNYSVTQATLDVPLPSDPQMTLASNCSQITNAMNAWGQKAIMGNTNIEAGLTIAKNEVTGSHSRTVADRTIILLTDGVATSGSLDIAGIALANRQNSQIMTHVITFGGQAAVGSVQTTMQNAAQNGNGNFYNAPTATQLQQAFQDIADSLPAVLTD